jgi:uncharacterized membrane protein YwzB
MNNLTRTRPDREAVRQTPFRSDAVVVLVATVVAALVWAATQAVGIDLLVRSGSGAREVALAPVVLTPLLVGFAAVRLLRLLERRTANGLRTWTVTASALWVVSFVGPLSATTVWAGLALATMHLAVGAVVVGGLRLTRVA